MNNQLDGFEKSLKQAFENYEVPYQEGSWEAIKNRVQPASAGSNSSMTTVIAVVVAACAGLLLGWYFFGTGNGQPAKSANLTTLTMERDSFPGLHERTSQLNGDSDDMATGASHFDALTGLSQSSAQADSDAPNTPNGEDGSNTAFAALNAPKEAQASGADQLMSEAEATVERTEKTTHAVAEIPAEGDMPAIPISVSTREACEGTSVKFHINAEVVDGNYLWNFGDGSFSNDPNPEHLYHKAGTYDITLSVTSNKDGVIRTKTMDQLIVINPKPEASFDIEFVGMDGVNPIVSFENNSRRANQAKWVIVDEFSEEINPVTRIERKGVHNIELVVSNDFGCDNRVTKEISLNEDYAMMAPTRFSPNNDGTFDTFMPRTLLNGEYNFTMRIYQGDALIYETTESTQPWNGTLPNGELAEPGERYTWMVLLHQPKGDKFYSGEVTVVR